MHAIMAYGFYKYFHGVREQRYVWRKNRLPSSDYPDTLQLAFFLPSRT